MKKVFQSVLFLFLAGLMSVNAQVRIGANEDPHAGSVLDLTNSKNLGLKLPVVSLQNAEFLQVGVGGDTVDDDLTAAGMVVYNTNANALVGIGVYYWDGHVWTGINTQGKQAKPTIATCAPDYYTPDNTRKVSITVKNTAKTGDTTLVFLTYNLGANPNLTPKQQMAYQSTLTGETRTDITVYGGSYQWGRKDVAHSFRCDYADDLTANHSDLFTQTLYTSATLAAADKFVWGPSGSNVTNNSDDWYSPHTDASTLWGNGNTVENGGNVPSAGTNNPCPAGFRVPTQHEWALLGNEGGSSTSTSDDEFSVSDASGTLPNSGLVWVPVKNGVPSTDWATTSEGDASYDNFSDLTGYALYTSEVWTNGFSGSGKSSLIDIDDPEPLMFLPAAGGRGGLNGRVFYVGSDGLYWSTTVSGRNGRFMYFNSSQVSAFKTLRDSGLSVRCLSEF